MPETTFSTRKIDGLWHMVATTNGVDDAYPAGTELHAQVMASLARERHDRKRAGLPPIDRR